MSIGKKLVIAGIGVSAMLGLVLFALALWQGNTTRTIAAQEVREQSRNGLEHVVAGIAAMVHSQREVLEQKAAADLNVAQHLLQQTGRVCFDREQMVEWQAVNQITKDSQTVRLPRMLCGETWLGQNADMSRPSPVVDRLKELVGGTATIFQRMNDAGDMLRVVTNVETLENKRAISTFIPAVTPDGTPNPVLAKILSGERFVGRAFVVNRWYVTAYEPIRVEGKVAGALFVGVPEESAVSLRRQIMDIVVGETGYVYVLDPKGNYVISHKGQRDGENVWEAKDADGKLFIQDAVTRAMALKSGEFCEISYPWKNQGDAAPRNKTVTLAYYEPWQWIIGAGTWDEEFMKGEMLIHDANARASKIMIGLVLVMLSAAAVVWLFIARSITRPIVRTADMLKDISEGEGDLTKRLAVTSNDEVGRLARHFNYFVEKLQSLIGQIADSVNLVASSSTELAATAAQLASGAEETTNQSAQVAAAAEQMSTNMTTMSASTDQVSTRVRTVSAAVEQVTASIGEMAKSAERAASAAASATQLVESSHTQITDLGTAADQIGKVIEVIQDIAEQTNLLALNATIEAARAGDAGRGFAVVATEVKELAKQTAGATEDIRRRIEGIQSSTGLAVSSMGGIGDVIRQVNELSRTIASAVEEQSITTREIAGNIAESSTAAEAVAKGVAESSVASQEIARIVVGVDQAARQSSQGATQTQSTGRELSTVAEQLRALVGQFKI